MTPDQGGAGAVTEERYDFVNRCSECGARLHSRPKAWGWNGEPISWETVCGNGHVNAVEQVDVIPDPTPELAERHPDIDWSQGVVEGVLTLDLKWRGWKAAAEETDQLWHDERADADRLAEALERAEEWIPPVDPNRPSEDGPLDPEELAALKAQEAADAALAEHKRRRDDG